jgi:subtilisin family serine protease
VEPGVLAIIDPGGVAARRAGDGYAIVWAVLGSGIQASHPHFRRYENLVLPAPLRHCDFTQVDVYRVGESDETLFAEEALIDLNGFGTHIAGIIAGYGDETDATIDWGTDDPPVGIAPRCKLLSLKVIDDEGRGRESSVSMALQHVMTLNETADTPRVHGVLIPLSLEFDLRNYACGQSPVCQAVNKLVASGVVVVAAGGNTGEKGFMTITDPGNAEHAITVGSTHHVLPQMYGPSYYSSRGPTSDGRPKPDVLAPGEKILSAIPAEPEVTRAKKKGKKAAARPVATYARRDGTACAAAVVAGAVAALLSVRKDLIGHPEEVKKLLLDTATDLGRDRYLQGHGLINLSGALGSTARIAELPEKNTTPTVTAPTAEPSVVLTPMDASSAAPVKGATPGKRFAVALSYAAEQRDYVVAVYKGLRELGRISRASIFYDRHFEGELSRVNLDTYLQDIYLNQSELVVAFFSADYARKQWTKIEGRVIREMIKREVTGTLMFVRFDDAEIPGMFSIDSEVWAKGRSPQEIADVILDRLEANRDGGRAQGPTGR